MGFEASRADYLYIYIDAAVMWALKPLGQTMHIYISLWHFNEPSYKHELTTCPLQPGGYYLSVLLHFHM